MNGDAHFHSSVVLSIYPVQNNTYIMDSIELSFILKRLLQISFLTPCPRDHCWPFDNLLGMNETNNISVTFQKQSNDCE
jgi:hypothetical protein